jgi:hypothetical protein
MSSELNETNLQDEKQKTKLKNKNYFDIREEQAVKDYITAESYEEKERIYNTYLRDPLDKMIESIIRRYKLYRKDMNYNDVHSDTHSFLMTKVDKFKPAKNKKAYSYFGTICKNYLMGQILKDQKETNRKISYEDISSTLENRPDMVYYIEFEKVDAEKIINVFLTDLKVYVTNNVDNENELKLGHALIELFDNYGNIFIGNDNNKFNKNIILLSLREMTNLSTKEIRGSMKKYKTMYYTLVENMVK